MTTEPIAEEGAPPPAAETALHPNQVHVLRIRTILTGLALVAILFGLDKALGEEGVATPVSLPAIGALLVLIGAFVLPGRRYRSWSYGVSEEELHLRHGLMVRVRTLVPFQRVQHIDVAQGPLQRAFGLATLVLHTPGTAGATISIPGLAHAEAERLRQIVRAKMREEPE